MKKNKGNVIVSEHADELWNINQEIKEVGKYFNKTPFEKWDQEKVAQNRHLLNQRAKILSKVFGTTIHSICEDEDA